MPKFEGFTFTSARLIILSMGQHLTIASIFVMNLTLPSEFCHILRQYARICLLNNVWNAFKWRKQIMNENKDMQATPTGQYKKKSFNIWWPAFLVSTALLLFAILDPVDSANSYPLLISRDVGLYLWRPFVVIRLLLAIKIYILVIGSWYLIHQAVQYQLLDGWIQS